MVDGEGTCHAEIHSLILITNTNSVGVVGDAVIEWYARRMKARDYDGDISLPVVAKTWDGVLNDINGCHVTQADAWAAMDAARGGPVAEGHVGGGTGMVCHAFKGGTGTASRRLSADLGGYTVGVLVQANYGRRGLLQIAGVPVGVTFPTSCRARARLTLMRDRSSRWLPPMDRCCRINSNAWPSGCRSAWLPWGPGAQFVG